jgi:hypothetical protein
MKLKLNALFTILVACIASPAFSACNSAPPYWTEETGLKIAEFGDWAVASIVERNQCWLFSNPIESIIDNNDDPEEFCRGTSRLVINFFPESNINGEFSYDSGYYFDASKEVYLETSSLSMELPNREDGIAWASSKKDDDALISEFELNEYVAVHGTASSSVTIDDVFSLSGFSDALNRAKVECGLIDLVS